MLEILSFVQGPVATNVYLVADLESNLAVVIDPAWDGNEIWQAAQQRGWRITALWLTHAHFDHIAGAAEIARLAQPEPPIGLHQADLPLYQRQGGAQLFGLKISEGPTPRLIFEDGQNLFLGDTRFEIRHTPGHTPGHVVICCLEEKVVFCGDVIFTGSIGRTDLPGGNYGQLIKSIQDKLMSLPDDTRILSGHGSETTVGQERSWNPYLQ